MPYIKEHRRDEIIKKVIHSGGMDKMVDLKEITNCGELNFAMTMMMLQYLKSSKGKYQDLNDIVGAVESAKVEFQRRAVAHYEDLKIKENGDVY